MHQSPYADNNELILAHMSPSEVRQLVELQGSHDHDPHTRLTSFRRLGEMMEHPEVRKNMIEWEGNRFAGGGEVEGLNHLLRKSGRYGDTDMVHLPRPLADLFDRALSGGSPSINPQTGKREYFLGGLFSGLSSVLSPIKNVIGSAFNAVKPIAGSVMQHFAPMAGQLAGTALSGAAERYGMGPLGADLGQHFGNTVGHLMGNFGQSLAGGSTPSPQQVATQGATHFGSYAIPRMADAAQNYAQNKAQNYQNPYVQAMLHHGAGAGASMMNSMGENAINSLNSGQNPNFLGAANRGVANYMGGIQHPIPQAIARTAQNYAA